ncbi:MAG: hypothetical protein N3A62_09010 [Thermodesulfovibrionales bacterium]|nr:hypothetical protein [Thermodesulfovibrionales bacterium]
MRCKFLFSAFVVAVCLVVFPLVATAQDPSDVGTPAFKPITSKTMTLKYGIKGASVYDTALKKWQFLKMTTITRSKVEGFVNQINDKFALAAGIGTIAIYDFAKHRWVVREHVTVDDSTQALRQNIILTRDYALVKVLNGPFLRYTYSMGWQEYRK